MKKFNLQLFADSYTSSSDLVIPFQKVVGMSSESIENFTFKIPNPKTNLTLAEVTTAITTWNTNAFFKGAGDPEGTIVSTRETPYIENKSIVTLDLEE